ncbi:ROK family protein [Tessaracoccus antarcticus]|uniref:ROK family protein n=1 Tax=Tessaracoccus antarcticus TaxID=2479848 RepID=A0A3M0GBP2_9ACTN|nr:ROK family protein [Tessaracoccus antarcticus]RMB62314.1 ROK family protein [Tessaracoccus antarcticus]
MLTDSEAALAEAVLLHGPLSRRSLTSRLGLSAASLTRLAKPFLARGLFVELEEVPDGLVGRPTKPLDIAPNLPFYAGVKVTGDLVHVVATDVRVNEIANCEMPLRDTSPSEVISVIAEAVDRLGVTGIAGLGVSLGGSVADGIVARAPFLGWTNLPFVALLENVVRIPVTLENDLVALAEAQRWFGLGKGLQGFAVVTVGAGVGYALVSNGTVSRSHDSGIGVAAHIPLSSMGPTCHEGHIGCAQAMLTSEFIAASVSSAIGRTLTWAEAVHVAQDEPPARAVMDASGEALGRLVALAANLSLQSDVILAGEGIALFDLTEETVRRAVSSHRDPLASPVALHIDRSGFRAWARGAAAVAIQTSLRRLTLH